MNIHVSKGSNEYKEVISEMKKYINVVDPGINLMKISVSELNEGDWELLNLDDRLKIVSHYSATYDNRFPAIDGGFWPVVFDEENTIYAIGKFLDDEDKEIDGEIVHFPGSPTYLSAPEEAKDKKWKFIPKYLTVGNKGGVDVYILEPNIRFDAEEKLSDWSDGVKKFVIE